MRKRIVIFGNGRLHEEFLAQVERGDYIIGVDRAAYWLMRHNVIPDIAIGDFDSTSEEQFRYITKFIRTVKRFIPEKNRTDMELAITHAVDQNPSEVIIVGGTGTRHDHTLGTLHILDLLLRAGVAHTLLDETNRIRLIGRGKTVIEKASYRYISLLPYTKSISVSLTGFRYNLVRKTLKSVGTRGISNELRGNRGTIHIFSGKAWVIESND